ncbi:MAG: FmdB family transcriptional regulator [Firmicutes bacterium]|nr:FmdB family transcriptional regulator [Bacillota bacterium]
MPTYEYACDKCGRFEVVQKITADPLTECPTCGGHVQRLVSKNVGIIFKGSGFYITDTRAANKSAETSSDEKAS